MQPAVMTPSKEKGAPSVEKGEITDFGIFLLSLDYQYQLSPKC